MRSARSSAWRTAGSSSTTRTFTWLGLPRPRAVDRACVRAAEEVASDGEAQDQRAARVVGPLDRLRGDPAPERAGARVGHDDVELPGAAPAADDLPRRRRSDAAAPERPGHEELDDLVVGVGLHVRAGPLGDEDEAR